MNRISLTLFISLFISVCSNSQTVLKADGLTDTYSLINNVLAPGYNVVETCDQCGDHSSFGYHITQNYDNDLATHVFQFHSHVNEDTDRCKPANTDRQRNEIKTYDKSPDNLLGTENEKIQYKWRFKLDSDFQVSSNFTHLHQLKSVGGPLESMPMYTLTARKSNPDRLELRYAETDKQITLKQTDLEPFRGTWLEVTETITYGISGNYNLNITKVGDNSVLFNYSNNSIVNWRPDAEFVRPKWGIYRSLINAQDLRDETVLFEYFSIEELDPLSVNGLTINKSDIQLIPNPSNNTIVVIKSKSDSFDYFLIYNHLGQKLSKQYRKTTLNTSTLKSGTYIVVFYKNNRKIATHKLAVI